MKGLKPFLSLGLGLLFALLTGCAGHAPPNGPGPLNIAHFTLTNGVLGVPYRQLLIVSGGVSPYTWTISSGSLPPGLSLDTNGVISGTPTSDPTLTYPQTYNFTAKVVDSQTPVAAFNSLTTAIIINPVLSFLSSSLPAGIVGTPYSTTVAATNGLAPYTYSIAFGALPDGLILDPVTGIIAGVPTTAGVFSFTIQATDADSEVATAAFTITVVGRLQGNYVINFNGFANGQPFYMVGSFVADGNGNLTSGVLDQNGSTGLSANVPLMAGSVYSIPTGSSFGTVTLVSSLGTFVYNILLATTVDSKLILADPNHAQMWGSGLVKKQSAASLSLTGNPTAYGFGFFGNDANSNRYVGAGMFQVTTSLAVAAGAKDTNDNGTASGEVPITGGGFVAADPTTGRGTYSLLANGVTTNYAYYVVSQTELVAVQIDASAPVTLVSILQQQSAGITGGTLSLCKQNLRCQSAIELSGVSTTGGLIVPDASVGIATFDGFGNIARSDGLPGYYTDQNRGGTYSAVQYAAGTYSIDATCGTIFAPCGRVTVNLTGANAQPVWYLVNTGQAFVVGTDSDAIVSGTLQPQSAGPFTVASVLGSYLGGTIAPALQSITNELDVISTPPPGGNFAIQYETNGPNDPAGGTVNQSFNGPYDCGGTPTNPACSAMGAAFGRFEMTSTGPGSPVITILYVVGSGAAGASGGKTGLVGLNVGKYDGTPDPNPRLSTFGR